MRTPPLSGEEKARLRGLYEDTQGLPRPRRAFLDRASDRAGIAKDTEGGKRRMRQVEDWYDNERKRRQRTGLTESYGTAPSMASLYANVPHGLRGHIRRQDRMKIEWMKLVDWAAKRINPDQSNAYRLVFTVLDRYPHPDRDRRGRGLYSSLPPWAKKYVEARLDVRLKRYDRGFVILNRDGETIMPSFQPEPEPKPSFGSIEEMREENERRRLKAISAPNDV